MSYLQAPHDACSHSPGTAPAYSSERVLCHPDEVVWHRRDWGQPVGAFMHMTSRHVISHVRDVPVNWLRISVAELWLGHRATLLLLQGEPLSNILMPGHELRHSTVQSVPVGHLLLRVDPWEYWRPRSVLTGLVFANLYEELQKGLAPMEVIGALAADSS